MIGAIGIILSLVLIVFFAINQWSALYGTLICATIVVFTNSLNWTEAITQSFLPGMSTFLTNYYGMIILGALLAKLYGESGAAVSISKGIFNAFCKPEASERTKQRMAILIILIAGGIMTYGGIHVSVLMLTLYPLALDICKQADIPRKFVIGLIWGSTCTFAMVGPGTPQLVNVVPMTVLGTPSTAALIPGIVGFLVEMVVMFFLLDWMFTKEKKSGTGHFEYGPKDIPFDDNTPRPPFIIALLPILTVFVLFNFVKMNVTAALAIAVPMAIVLFWKQLPKNNIIPLLNSGAAACTSGVLIMASMTGFAAVIKSTAGFQSFLDAFIAMNLNPYIKVIVCIAGLACLTGAASTGILLVLPEVAPGFIASGISANAIHRIATFSASTLDSLPSCGGLLMLCDFADIKVKDAYPATFVVSIVATTLGTIAVTLMLALFPALA